MANEIERRHMTTPAPSAGDLAERTARAVGEHAAHFDRLNRAADLARRLELVALIAERCGWERPFRASVKAAGEALQQMERERRRAERLLRGLGTDDALYAEVQRLGESGGELENLAGRLRAILRPAGPDLISEELSAMLAAAPFASEAGLLYFPSATASLARDGFSIGAVILGLGDVGEAAARRFGRPPVDEIRSAIEAREADLEYGGDALAWLADHAAGLSQEGDNP